MTRTRLGPSTIPNFFVLAICLRTLSSHPFGCAVVHINPFTFGSTTICYSFLCSRTSKSVFLPQNHIKQYHKEMKNTSRYDK